VIDEILLLPKSRTAPTPQCAKEGSNAKYSGELSCPLAANCQPLTVMELLFSMSMAPTKFLLIVPAVLVLAIPAPFGFAPPPSSVTKLEFSTTIPIPAL